VVAERTAVLAIVNLVQEAVEAALFVFGTTAETGKGRIAFVLEGRKPAFSIVIGAGSGLMSVIHTIGVTLGEGVAMMMIARGFSH